LVVFRVTFPSFSPPQPSLFHPSDETPPVFLSFAGFSKRLLCLDTAILFSLCLLTPKGFLPFSLPQRSISLPWGFEVDFPFFFVLPASDLDLATQRALKGFPSGKFPVFDLALFPQRPHYPHYGIAVSRFILSRLLNDVLLDDLL